MQEITWLGERRNQKRSSLGLHKGLPEEEKNASSPSTSQNAGTWRVSKTNSPSLGGEITMLFPGAHKRKGGGTHSVSKNLNREDAVRLQEQGEKGGGGASSLKNAKPSRKKKGPRRRGGSEKGKLRGSGGDASSIK